MKQDEWCQAYGITTGYDFLLLWCALVIQMPKQHLPMLYFYSPKRNNGESTFLQSSACCSHGDLSKACGRSTRSSINCSPACACLS